MFATIAINKVPHYLSTKQVAGLYFEEKHGLMDTWDHLYNREQDWDEENAVKEITMVDNPLITASQGDLSKNVFRVMMSEI
jgi:hypothetical protein